MAANCGGYESAIGFEDDGKREHVAMGAAAAVEGKGPQ